MVPVLFADVLQYAFGILMSVSALLLILLVLVQRGRGGGLAGALGGMGGQSAFGTKAGDTFTKVTIAVASIWIVLCLAAVFILRQQTQSGRRIIKAVMTHGCDFNANLPRCVEAIAKPFN